MLIVNRAGTAASCHTIAINSDTFWKGNYHGNRQWGTTSTHSATQQWSTVQYFLLFNYLHYKRIFIHQLNNFLLYGMIVKRPQQVLCSVKPTYTSWWASSWCRVMPRTAWSGRKSRSRWPHPFHCPELCWDHCPPQNCHSGARPLWELTHHWPESVCSPGHWMSYECWWISRGKENRKKKMVTFIKQQYNKPSPAGWSSNSSLIWKFLHKSIQHG